MKGIIFDMDGTMVDNMMVHHRAWQQKLAEWGLPMELEEVMEKVHGINEEILERLFGDRFTPEERRKLAFEKEEAYRQIFKPQLRLIDGLPELLEDLHQRGIPMGVGSAAPPENVDFVMDTLEIRHYFQAIKHSKDVEKGKPDPEIYHKVAAAMGLEAADTVVFEDSPVGAEAGQRADASVIVITTTHKEAEFQHLTAVERFIEDFRGLTPEGLAS